MDPTFSLGAFDVSLTTYRHLFLQSKRYKSSPVLVGPICIHYKKNFSTYLFFASTLIGQCRTLESIRVIGTDGEKALLDAFKHEFGFAQHLTCFIHVRRNIKDKLRECCVSNHLTDEILNDILGKKMGSEYVEGLVDAQDNEDFEVKTDRLILKWRTSSQPSISNVEGFISWFREHKAVTIKQSMIRPIREDCGLGSPPTHFTTNACEAANSVLKKTVNYQRSELPDFIQKLKDLITEQYREVERAIIGRGKYELRPQYQSWQVSESKWFTMSSKQERTISKSLLVLQSKMFVLVMVVLCCPPCHLAVAQN